MHTKYLSGFKGHIFYIYYILVNHTDYSITASMTLISENANHSGKHIQRFLIYVSRHHAVLNNYLQVPCCEDCAVMVAIVVLMFFKV